jgi:hypothetical protein
MLTSRQTRFARPLRSPPIQTLGPGGGVIRMKSWPTYKPASMVADRGNPLSSARWALGLAIELPGQRPIECFYLVKAFVKIWYFSNVLLKSAPFRACSCSHIWVADRVSRWLDPARSALVQE